MGKGGLGESVRAVVVLAAVESCCCGCGNHARHARLVEQPQIHKSCGYFKTPEKRKKSGRVRGSNGERYGDGFEQLVHAGK